jgi:hypothetical protein
MYMHICQVRQDCRRRIVFNSSKADENLKIVLESWLDTKGQEGVITALVRSEDLAEMSQVWETSHGRFFFSVFLRI